MRCKSKAIETYEKRFGNIAVEKGFVSPENLYRAFEIQTYGDIKNKSYRLIGEILLRKDFLSLEQIEEVVKEIIGRNQ